VVVALSTTKVEYMEATHGRKEEVCLQRMCSRVMFERKSYICFSSQSTILIAKNPTYHSKTKHIYVQYHFVNDMVERKKVLLEIVDTLENREDSLTKCVNDVKLSWCREEMGIVALDLRTKVQETPNSTKNKKSGRILGCYILCSESRAKEDRLGVKVEG
jgi:hypothetical protein